MAPFNLHFLLLAALFHPRPASTQDLWMNPANNDLTFTTGNFSQDLLVFTSRSFESRHNHHGFLERLQSDRRLQTRVIMVDCDTDLDLCRQHDVNEYPAIRLHIRDEAKDRSPSEEESLIRYRGRRTERAIRSFLIKYEYAPVTAVEDREHLTEFKKIDNVVIVAYVSEASKSLETSFLPVAEMYYKDFIFGYTTDEKVAEEEGISVPSIVIYKNNDGDHKVRAGDFTREDVEAFLATAPRMLIGDFTERTLEKFMAPGKLSVYLFATTEDEADFLRHELTPIARKYEQYVTFGVADAIEYGPMAINFGLTIGRFPALAVHAPMNDHVFTYVQGRKIVANVIENMLLTILQGEATVGQGFGSEAPKEPNVEAERGERQRDEL